MKIDLYFYIKMYTNICLVTATNVCQNNYTNYMPEDLSVILTDAWTSGTNNSSNSNSNVSSSNGYSTFCSLYC